MAEMRRICRTAASSITHRRLYICMIERRIISYSEVREVFRDYAIPSLREYLLPDMENFPPSPPSDWGSLHDPFQPVDTAYFKAVMSPWNRLFISQFVEYVRSKMLVGIPLPLIFTSPATKYEAWKMDKEYKDLYVATTTLEKSVKAIKERTSIKSPPTAHGVKRRAQRLRSRGFGSGLREVISVDEEWPEEGWASSVVLKGVSYDVRLQIRMKEKGRPFLLDNDPTDRSGIIPESRLLKMLKLD